MRTIPASPYVEWRTLIRWESHTGESVVVAPILTLRDDEYHLIRNSALKIIRALNVQGGCNVQFAFNGEKEVPDYRSEPTGFPFVGTGIQGHRISHREGSSKDCHRNEP